MKKYFQINFIVSVVTLVFLTNCGYYSFKGSLPSHLKTIAVPLFSSQAPDPGVGEDITNLLIDGFIADNTLKIADQSKADLILTGTVTQIVLLPAIVRPGETVAESRLRVTVRAKCDDIHRSKVLFNKTFSQEETLEASAGLEERNAAVKDALEIISEDIINSTLSGW